MLSPALLIIDHIHFQYNGFLYGILVLSLVAARKQSTLLLSGLLFAVLLCLKHIYLYLAPAYFIYLLRVYCLSSKSTLRIRFGNATSLASGLLIVFGVMFGPFVYWKQIDQLLARLFPFARGLCHAYWAPNIWSMYSFTDRVLLLGRAPDSFWPFQDSTDNSSGPKIWIRCRSNCPEQCYKRLDWRFVFCMPAEHIAKNNLHVDSCVANGTCLSRWCLHWLIFSSQVLSSCSLGLRGRLLWVQSPSADTRRSCLDGTSMRRPSCWSLFRLVSSLYGTEDTLAPFDRWLLQDMSRSSPSFSPLPNFQSRQYTRFSGLFCSCLSSIGLHLSHLDRVSLCWTGSHFSTSQSRSH